MNTIPIRASTLFLFSGLLLLLAPTILHAAAVHHDIAATLEPDSSVIKVSDAITFGDLAHSSLIFELHEALEVSSSDSNVLSLQAVQEASPTPLGGGGAAIYNRYLVKLKDSSKPFTLTYQGAILPAVDSDGEVVETTGVINNEGIFLARSSRWFPVFPKINFLTFRLAVTLPKGWKTISQGNVSRGGAAKPSEGSGDIDSVTFQWQEEHPQDDIYLIAARFHAYIQQNDKVQAQVLLREADEALAQKYLDATGQYIEMYSRLLGDYPYQKFALVENFWETGYGMPSFTLLGSKVLRFPFILYTSYPHEILHNWWGNSVYIDYDSGNWAEGLTAYLADHLMKEQRGQARLYRRGVLQKYTDHVKDGDDFPLSEFRSRHNADSAAIGYGKTAMLFHMLRLELGERVFVKSLRQLYKEQIYKITSFADIQRIFSENA
ncbi:MAG: M1 family aminopeptidase, partial [Thiohalomonadales bacterium]